MIEAKHWPDAALDPQTVLLDHAKKYAQSHTQLKDITAKLMAWHRADELSRCLEKIPGVGRSARRTRVTAHYLCSHESAL